MLVRRFQPNFGEKELSVYNAKLISNKMRAASIYIQTIELVKRAFKNSYRHYLFLARIVNAVISCFITCSIYYQLDTSYTTTESINNAMGGFFLLAMFEFIRSLGSVILTYASEKVLILKETSAQLYNVEAYFISKTVVEAPFYALFPIIQAAISYYIMGYYPSDSNYLLFILFYFLLAIVANAFGVFIGVFFSDDKTATSMLGPIFSPFLLFSGFYIALGNVSPVLRWLQYLTPIRFLMEGLMRNEFYTQQNHGKKLYFDPIQEFGYDLGISECIYIMLILFGVYRTAAYFMLKLQIKFSRTN